MKPKLDNSFKATVIAITIISGIVIGTTVLTEQNKLSSDTAPITLTYDVAILA